MKIYLINNMKVFSFYFCKFMYVNFYILNFLFY